MPNLPFPPSPPFTRGDLVTLKANTPCPSDWKAHVWQHFLGKKWTVKDYYEESGYFLLDWSNGIAAFVTTAQAEALTRA